MKAMDETLKDMVFHGDEIKVKEYHSLTSGMQETLLQNVKMSAFAEDFFERFSKIHHTSMLINKGGYY